MGGVRGDPPRDPILKDFVVSKPPVVQATFFLWEDSSATPPLRRHFVDSPPLARAKKNIDIPAELFGRLVLKDFVISKPPVVRATFAPMGR